MIFYSINHDYLLNVLRQSPKKKSIYRIYDISARKCGPYTYFTPDKYKYPNMYPFLIVLRQYYDGFED